MYCYNFSRKDKLVLAKQTREKMGVLSVTDASKLKISKPASPKAASQNASVLNSSIKSGQSRSLLKEPQELHQSQASHAAENKSTISAANRTLTFDLDETLVSAQNLTEAMKAQGQELGYQLLTSKAGKEYFLRPGVIDLFKNLKSQGFNIAVASRNFETYVKDIVSSSEMAPYVSRATGIESILGDTENMNFERFPHHPNNVGIFGRIAGITQRFTSGMVKSAKRMVMSLWNKNIHAYFPQDLSKSKKYPPYLSGSHVLFDNLYTKVKVDAYRSKDWVAKDPGFFDGTEPEKKLPNGQYEWVANVLAAAEKLKDPKQGWQALYREEFDGEDPIEDPVEVSPGARQALQLASATV